MVPLSPVTSPCQVSRALRSTEYKIAAEQRSNQIDSNLHPLADLCSFFFLALGKDCFMTNLPLTGETAYQRECFEPASRFNSRFIMISCERLPFFSKKRPEVSRRTFTCLCGLCGSICTRRAYSGLACLFLSDTFIHSRWTALVKRLTAAARVCTPQKITLIVSFLGILVRSMRSMRKQGIFNSSSSERVGVPS